MTSGSSVGEFLDFMTCIFQLMLIIYLNWKLHNRFCCNEQKLVCIIMYKSTKYFALVKVTCKASHLLEHFQLNLVKVKKNQQKCTFFYLHISKRRKKNLYNDIDKKIHFTSKTFFMYVLIWFFFIVAFFVEFFQVFHIHLSLSLRTQLPTYVLETTTHMVSLWKSIFPKINYL